MKRRTFTAAMGLGLLAGPVIRAAQAADLVQSAKQEGTVTWYVAHYSTRLSELLAKRFMELNPGINVDVVRATSQATFQRLMQDIRANARNCDVFSSSDPSHCLYLKANNHLLAHVSKTLSECLPDVQKRSDPDNYYAITDVFMTSLARNTNTVPEAEAPKNWTDLLDPKWKGQIALAHPGFSGDAGAWVVAMNRLYGWEFFEKLAANKPFVSRSIVDVPTTIGNGEAKIGVAPPNNLVVLATKGLPVAPVFPSDGVGTGFAPSAIMASTQRPNAAKLFLEYLNSKSASELLVPEFRIPIRADITPEPGIPTLETVKGYFNDPVEIQAKQPGLVQQWRATFGV